ncbi:hypothetical protein V495_02373 [Pseudogymnoascus sp. VKM F-4514 (FW-929)]|nr:hypothetical protein V495_02373 [Pseudogymnoascus sp. VKM F-4514 (FW-929)]KFY61689.1 hypothetical protein V497_02793 [Pseudogymnoascus sp. VKM F-4516 (FW-969)]
MDSQNPEQPVREHETELPTTVQHTAASVTTAAASTAIPTEGAPTAVSQPSLLTTPIAILSDAGGPPWPRPPTPGPGPTLPDRIFHFDSADTPPHTPIPSPNFPQHPISSDTFSNDPPNPLTSNRVNDSTSPPPAPLPDIFVPPRETPQVSSPVLRLRPGTGVREQYGATKPLGEMVRTDGFEVGDPADEDFYGATDIDLGSDASSLSSFWENRFYYNRSLHYNHGARDLGERIRAREHEHEPRTDNHDSASQTNTKGKHKVNDCVCCEPTRDLHHDSYLSDSSTAAGDDAPRRAGPFVPSFHDSQATPVKRGGFVFHGRYEADDGDVHERGGDGKDEAKVPAGCELEFPLVSRGSENWQTINEGMMLAPLASRREIHRLPASVPVCIRRPSATTPFYRGHRRHRLPIPEFVPNPSVIQLLTPQGRVVAQFNNVADVQVTTTEMKLIRGDYRMREIRNNGGCDEVRRGWGGIKGCMVELKGGDKWELKSSETETSRDIKKRRKSPSGFHDGDDEGTIGAASDVEKEVARLDVQLTNRDFILGPGDMRPYILDVIHDDSDNAISRYTDVVDYSVSILRAEKGNSFTVGVRGVTGALVITWKRVVRVEIVLVGGVTIQVNVGGKGESEDDGGEVAAAGVGLRGGGDKDNEGESGREEKTSENAEEHKEKGQATTGSSSAVKTSESSRYSDYPGELGFQGGDSTHSAAYESGAGTPKKTGKDKGKGKAVDDGNATPRDRCHSSDSENHGSIPLCYEAPADYVQTLGPPRRLENPEPDYVLGSCPCLDRPITNTDTDADPPRCTCIHPASPEPPAMEPWASGYFSRRYQEFLRDGPRSAPYSHSCTGHSESHGEWLGQAKENLGVSLTSYVSGSEVPGHVAINGGSSTSEPLVIKQSSGGSPNEGAPIFQRDDAEAQQVKDTGSSQATASVGDRPSKEAGAEAKAAEPDGLRSDSRSNEHHNIDTRGNSSAHVDRDAVRRNTAGRGQSHAYTGRHASPNQSFQGAPQLPMFYPLYPPLYPPSHFARQPTIITIQFFPPHELPNINYHPPFLPSYPSFTYHNPFIPHPQNSHSQNQTTPPFQQHSALPGVPENNYFYPDGRPARLLFRAPPDQEAGQQQSAGNHEPAPPTATQNPGCSTQTLPPQPVHPVSSSRGDRGRLVEDEVARLKEATDLLREFLERLRQ